jgi:hypothetical protein
MLHLVLLTICLAAHQAVSWELFASGDGFYNYAPCAIEDGEVHHFWWCQNTDPYQIADHIYYRRFTFSTKRWTARALALAPGAPGEWDSLHVCDPAVVKGLFLYRGVRYAYALLYLGTDLPTLKHNQVGIAFATSPEGPWVRYAGNPIVRGSAATWGAGQPSVISLDRQGRLLLFYTRQHEGGATYTYLAEVDFSDMEHPVIGAPRRVPTGGLSERAAGRAVVLHDADFAFDPTRKVFFLVRPQHPGEFGGPNPAGLCSHLEVASIPADALRAGKGHWTVVGHLGPEQTGFAYNHSPALAPDPYGWVPDPHHLRINFTVAARQREPLWSYALHGFILDLP